MGKDLCLEPRPQAHWRVCCLSVLLLDSKSPHRGASLVDKNQPNQGVKDVSEQWCGHQWQGTKVFI